MKPSTKVFAVSGVVLFGVLALCASDALNAPIASDPIAVALSERVAERPEAPAADPVVAAAAPAPIARPDERQQLDQAERILFDDPMRAMAMLRAGDAEFPHSALAEQRQLLKLRARVNLDQIPEARVDATEYLERNPRSPIAGDIHQLLGIHPPPQMGPP